MKSETAKNPPLSSATLHILLALAGGNLHGYGIIKEVVRNSDGHYKLGPGTLYDNLKKLMDAGLVSDAPPSSSAKRKSAAAKEPKEDDRRFFALTRQGKDALAAEVDRLQSVVSQARLRLREAKVGRA
jgi:DNA-binding PadR family transcriptional regulator